MAKHAAVALLICLAAVAAVAHHAARQAPLPSGPAGQVGFAGLSPATPVSGGETPGPYPPPRTVAAETATPRPRADGLFPPPNGIRVEVLSLADSPYRSMIAPIEEALRRRDARALAAMVAAEDLDWVEPLVNIYIGWGEPDAYLTSDELARALAASFDLGSSPRIQGYLVDHGRDGSVTLFVTGWVGPVPLPHTLPTWTPTPEGASDGRCWDVPASLCEDAAYATELPGGTYVWDVIEWESVVRVFGWMVADDYYWSVQNQYELQYDNVHRPHDDLGMPPGDEQDGTDVVYYVIDG